MKIYVAGKWEEKERAWAVMRMLEAIGHTITFDWTPVADTENRHELAHWAYQTAKGVGQADVLVALLENEYNYKGTWVEIGIALGMGKSVYIVGNAGDSCIFVHLPLVVRCPDLESCLRMLAVV